MNNNSTTPTSAKANRLKIASLFNQIKRLPAGIMLAVAYALYHTIAANGSFGWGNLLSASALMYLTYLLMCLLHFRACHLAETAVANQSDTARYYISHAIIYNIEWVAIGLGILGKEIYAQVSILWLIAIFVILAIFAYRLIFIIPKAILTWLNSNEGISLFPPAVSSKPMSVINTISSVYIYIVLGVYFYYFTS